MGSRPCVRAHPHESSAAAGPLLCDRCLRRAERQLRELPGLHRECLHQAAPTTAARPTNPTKVSASRSLDPGAGEHVTFVHECVQDGCGGTITAALGPGGSGSGGEGVPGRGVVCSAGHAWEAHEWLRLRHLMAVRARQRRGSEA